MDQKISLNFDVHSTNIGGKISGDKWSRDSYSYNWYFKGIQKGKGQHDTILKDYQPTKSIFVVYVTYSTGDSFGRNHNSECEVICATHSLETALKIKEFILKDNSSKDSQDEMKQKEIDGVTFFTYMWKDYFSSLVDVRIEICSPLG